MIYVVDTHIFIWLLDDNKRLSQKYKKILLSQKNNFVFSTIVLADVLAEIKYLIAVRRININFNRFWNILANVIIA